MASTKDTFKKGLNTLLSGPSPQQVTEPAHQNGTQDNPKYETHAPSIQYERTTFMANAAKMDKIRAIAFREDLSIKEVMEEIMDMAITAYEAQNGEIKVSPRKQAVKKKLFS